MPVKQWNVGDVLSAADMNAWTVPIAVLKPSDTNRNTTTTLTADPDLQIAVASGATYLVEAIIAYKGGANGSSDAQFTLTVPASSTGFFLNFRRSVSGLTFSGDYLTFGTASNSGTNGTGNPQGAILRASVTTAGTAGTVAVAWAQNTSSGTNTTVMAGSTLSAQRIA